MNTRNAIITVVILIVMVGVAAVLMFISPTSNKPINTVLYSCDGDKNITAIYYKGETKPSPSPDMPPIPGGSVAVTFGDGRAITLAQTLSADGVRYANADESLIFWSKGNGALVLENGQEKSYIGCIMVAP